MKSVHELTPAVARNVYRHLSHFVTLNENKQLSDEIQEYLIKQTLAHRQLSTVSAIITSLRDMFALEFEEFEVKKSLNRLAKRHVVRSIAGRPPRYALSTEAEQQIRNEWKENRALEDHVLEAWLEELDGKHQLTAADRGFLKHDLKAFLTNILQQYGIEYAKLAGAASPADVDRLADGNCLANLPARAQTLIDIRNKEFPLFLICNDENRLAYLSQLIQTVFVYFAVNVDPTLSALLRRSYAGGVVLLDTNLALHLLGLDGPDLQSASSLLVKYSRDLGYKPMISLKTTEELQTTITGMMKEFVSMKDNPTETFMNHVVSSVDYKEDIVKAYYRRYLETYRTTGKRLTRQAFAVSMSSFLDILELEHSIQVYKDHHDQVTEQWDRLSEVSKIVVEASSHRKQGPKTDLTALHDAHNRLLIKHIRSANPPRKLVEANSWFITDDRTLIWADQRCRLATELPTIVLADTWLNTIRLCLPRTKDAEALFARLLAEPYTRTIQIPSHVADKIGGYLALGETFDFNVAIRMLQDHLLTESLQNVPLAEVQVELDKAAARIAAEENQKRLATEVLLKQAEASLAEQTAKTLVQAEEAVRQESERVSILQEKAALEKRIAEFEAKELQREHDHHSNLMRRRRVRKAIGYVAIIGIVIVALLTSHTWTAWNSWQRLLLFLGITITLGLVALAIDGFAQGSKIIKRWAVWFGVNVFVICFGYMVVLVFAGSSISEPITNVANLVTLLGNPLGGLYLPSPTDQSKDNELAA